MVVDKVSACRYFTQYTGKGRYSVKCQVSGDSDTGVNGGFIGARVFPKVPDPNSPLCCGSDAMPAGSLVIPTGNFTRYYDPVCCQSSYIIDWTFQTRSWWSIPCEERCGSKRGQLPPWKGH